MELNKKKIDRILMTVIGNVLYACGVNLMINPIHLYSGGFTGITQLIRLFLTGFLHIPEIPGLDYMGIIYFAINIPLFFMAYRVMGRKFCITTLISIAMASAFLAFIPVPAVPIVDDRILASVVGGTIGIIISIGIYTICLFIYDIPTVMYSIIFAVVTGLAIDRVHVQNIKQECMIFTKKPDLQEAILHDLNRGATIWEGQGAYTGDDMHVLVTVISKYEEPHLREIIAKHDENAFMIISDNIRVVGLFNKRFTE